MKQNIRHAFTYTRAISLSRYFDVKIHASITKKCVIRTEERNAIIESSDTSP